MRTILPSSTSTKTGPPVVQFVSRSDFTHTRDLASKCDLTADRGRQRSPERRFIRDADTLARIMGIVSSRDVKSSAAAASARRAA